MQSGEQNRRRTGSYWRFDRCSDFGGRGFCGKCICSFGIRFCCCTDKVSVVIVSVDEDGLVLVVVASVILFDAVVKCVVS